jgi:hypothetical protein
MPEASTGNARNSGIDVRAPAIDGRNSGIDPEPSARARRPIEQMSATGQKSASGTCRDRRRPHGERRRWVRPFYRANRALNASLRLIGSTLHTVAATKRTARRRPVGASRSLQDASGLLVTASVRLMRAAQSLTEMTERARLEPETAEAVPEILVEATERWVFVSSWLAETANEVFALHHSVLDGLETGALVPERPADRRPRIVLAPRPVPIRAFLRLRQPRVHDRIAPLLLMRRRTPRPAALRVPRRSVLGRAPPLFSVCLR